MAIATPKKWRLVRGHDKPRLMGVAPSILSRWNIFSPKQTTTKPTLPFLASWPTKLSQVKPVHKTNCWCFFLKSGLVYTGVNIVPIQTIHYYKGSPSKLPYICIHHGSAQNDGFSNSSDLSNSPTSFHWTVILGERKSKVCTCLHVSGWWLKSGKQLRIGLSSQSLITVFRCFNHSNYCSTSDLFGGSANWPFLW